MDKPFVFDHLAIEYDKAFTQTLTGKAQRDLVWSYLAHHAALKKGTTCLEVNCGTGEDAVFLSNKGIQITATDRSKEMCAITLSKGIKQVLPLPFDELKQGLSDQKFDVIFSNFGGFNCINEQSLTHLLHDFSDLLTPNGRIIAVIMPKWCIWESFYFSLKLNKKAIFRRLKKSGVNFKIDASNLTIHYYNPSDIQQMASPLFKLISSKPIGVAIPPSYLEPFMKKIKWLLPLLRKTDLLLFKYPLWPSRIADHYLIELQKK